MFRMNIMSVIFCIFLVHLVSAITADERQDVQDQNSADQQQPTSYTFQTIRFGPQPGFQQLLQNLQQNSAQLESFDTPQAPQQPQVPQIPQRANIPNIPQPPAIPQYPTVPQIPQIPQYPQYPQTYSTNVFSTGQLPVPILPGQPLPSYSLNTIIPQGQYPYNLNSAASISNNYPLITNYQAGFATPINPNQLGQGRTFTVPAANPAFNPATPDPDSQTFPVNEVDGLTA